MTNVACRYGPNAPRALRVEFFAHYESGHMVYVHEVSLKALHDNVGAFIVATQNTN